MVNQLRSVICRFTSLRVRFGCTPKDAATCTPGSRGGESAGVRVISRWQRVRSRFKLPWLPGGRNAVVRYLRFIVQPPMAIDPPKGSSRRMPLEDHPDEGETPSRTHAISEVVAAAG